MLPIVGYRAATFRGFAAQGLLGIVALGLVTLAGLWLGLDLATAAFAYLIAIVLLSLVGSFRVAAIASLLAVAGLNYFFAAPLFDFRVEDALDVVLVVAFVLTSLVVTGLVGRAGRHAAAALQAGAKAEQAEADLRRAIDAIPALVWSALPDGSLDFINQRWEEIGLSLDDLRGSEWTAVIHPDHRPGVFDKWRAAVDSGTPYENIERVRRADGEYRWFLSRARPLRDESGSILKWYGTDTDIDDRIRGEQVLREQAGLLDLTHDTIFVRDMDDVITYWNRGAELLYGWTRAEALGQVSHRLTQTVFPEPLEAITATLLDTGRWEGELVHTKRDGSRVTVASRWSLWRDERDTAVAVLETNNDITERKQAEDALRRSEAYLAEAQRLSLTGSFGWNVASGEMHWSEQGFRIFGYESAIRPTLELALRRVHPDDLAIVRQTFARASKHGAGIDIECRLLRPDGSVAWVRAVGHLADSDSGQQEYVGALMDITAAKRAEDELQRVQAELAHVTRVTTLGELTASIAHEVNQPLAAIVTSGEACLRWLGHDAPQVDRARDCVRRMIESANRAGEVIARMRALARKSVPQKAPLDIGEIIEETIPLVQRAMLNNHVSLRLELAAGLPPATGDRIQLQQVIVNLLNNGIEAMAPVTDRARMLLIRTGRHEGGEVLVSIEDSGIGIGPENVDQLFMAFFTTKPSGMGMGLAICRSIIEAHGGRLWVARNADAGATFHFTLPAFRTDA